jgi:glutathione S-transferase
VSAASSGIRLYQIPFSHNSVKVRKVLDLKQLEYERVNINPAYRREVQRVSSQELTPVLVDGERVISDSTAIVLYLEVAYPEPALLPADPDERAECLVLEDWADSSFMELSRRLAYWRLTSRRGTLGELFFPQLPARIRTVADLVGTRILHRRFGMSAEQNARDEVEAQRLSELAVRRLAGRPFLVGDRVTIADITLASLSAPFAIASPNVAEQPSVRALVEWATSIIDPQEFGAAAAAAAR